jgi:hypothetical protein
MPARAAAARASASCGGSGGSESDGGSGAGGEAAASAVPAASSARAALSHFCAEAARLRCFMRVFVAVWEHAACGAPGGVPYSRFGRALLALAHEVDARAATPDGGEAGGVEAALQRELTNTSLMAALRGFARAGVFPTRAIADAAAFARAVRDVRAGADVTSQLQQLAVRLAGVSNVVECVLRLCFVLKPPNGF